MAVSEPSYQECGCWNGSERCWRSVTGKNVNKPFGIFAVTVSIDQAAIYFGTATLMLFVEIVGT